MTTGAQYPSSPFLQERWEVGVPEPGTKGSKGQTPGTQTRLTRRQLAVVVVIHLLRLAKSLLIRSSMNTNLCQLARKDFPSQQKAWAEMIALQGKPTDKDLTT